MSSGQSALENGRTQLITEFGQTFSYGGVDFKGVVETANQAQEFRKSSTWNPTHAFRIGVDPTQTAFNSGLPHEGDVIQKNSVDMLVGEVEHAPGHHVAYLSIRDTF
tara:strand:- start:714 stop:1034 length:321 start_codon:yes stop_codon:yes gene_type:complete